MLVDSHQHFWRYDRESYPWITDDLSVLRVDFLPEDLEPKMLNTGVRGSVAVQAVQSTTENQRLLDWADAAPTILGVVGWVDLTADQSRVDLELERFSAHPKAIGIRHIVQDEPDSRFLDREDFRRGVSRLPTYHLTYDLLIRPPQLPAALDFVPALPEVPMVLDHLGKPPIASGELENWRLGIETLARQQNLCAKVSGLVTEANWEDWQPQDLRPILDIALEAFGPDRLMLGSDWPVCNLAASYEQVFAVVQPWLQELSNDERRRIEAGTAIEFYQLDLE